MSLRRRLEWLEEKGRRNGGPPLEVGRTAREIQELDRDIARLRAEIAEQEARMTPEELARDRAESEEFLRTLEGLPLDEQIGALEEEIEILEAAAEAEEEGGGA